MDTGLIVRIVFNLITALRVGFLIGRISSRKSDGNLKDRTSLVEDWANMAERLDKLIKAKDKRLKLQDKIIAKLLKDKHNL